MGSRRVVAPGPARHWGYSTGDMSLGTSHWGHVTGDISSGLQTGNPRFSFCHSTTGRCCHQAPSSRCPLFRQGDTSVPDTIPRRSGTPMAVGGGTRCWWLWGAGEAPSSSPACCGWSRGVEVTRGDTAAQKAATRTMAGHKGTRAAALGPTLALCREHPWDRQRGHRPVAWGS